MIWTQKNTPQRESKPNTISDVYDTPISSLWQEIFQANSQKARKHAVRAFLAAGARHCVDQRAEKPEQVHETFRFAANTTGDFAFFE